ncbi:MAG: cyclopropane-fatty-acyl-phospholipid synthase family protein [Nitriliruptorales bacterium]|nr:cyclopropane-fatty-acyl-phospholipid synthase family protein [Nitriliruptorales bacterium]
MTRRPTGGDRAAVRAFAAQLEQMTIGSVQLVLPDGRRRTFGEPNSELSSDIEVRDWRFFHQVLAGGSIGVGESYMDGDWRSSDLVSLIRLVIANRDSLRSVTPGAVMRVAEERIRHALNGNRRRQSRRNIAAHYDLSNELYELFLDPSMTYSCAYFAEPGMSLEEAQRAKYRRIAEKARIEGGEHVLEIGCGWGGFAEFVAREYGCRVTGITLSEEQAGYARERLERAGLSDLVDIELVDYRDVDGRYDRVVSIEMLEAVGPRYLGTYFERIDELLAPDGVAAIQVITIPEQRYGRYKLRPDFIQAYIFPGGHLPSLEAMSGAMGRSSSLFVEDVENLGVHYAETLRRWRENFLAHEAEVRALGFDDRFVRMWEFYLAYCEGAFLARYINDLQLVLTRPMNATLGSSPYGADHALPSQNGDIRLVGGAA